MRMIIRYLFIIFASQFYVLYLVYKIIKILNPLFQKRYIKRWAISYISFVGFIFIASFVMVNLLYLFVFIFSPHFVSEKTFENREFYMYDSMMDICIKSNYHLTREKLITIENDYNLSLYQQGNKIILHTSTGDDIDIYDLNKSEKLYGGE